MCRRNVYCLWYTPNTDQQEVQQRVVAAAKLANAHDFITGFPGGYDTDVDNSGTAMSGGKMLGRVFRVPYRSLMQYCW
jgi:ABC-type transport system involved in Fe-S cluster assembly fused permease/ATPase subunit